MTILPKFSETIEVRYDAYPRRQTRAYSESTPTDDYPIRPNWWDDAKCRGVGAEAFFPAQHDSPKIVAKAKALCAVCPVVTECKETFVSLSWQERRHGVWFGTTPRERRSLDLGEGTRVLLHGTDNGYRYHGCRCGSCTRAHAAANRLYRGNP